MKNKIARRTKRPRVLKRLITEYQTFYQKDAEKIEEFTIED